MGDVGSQRTGVVDVSWRARACAALWFVALVGLWAAGLIVVMAGCGASDASSAAELLATSNHQAQRPGLDISAKSLSKPLRPKLLSNGPKPARIQRTSGTLSLVQASGRTIAYVADEDARAILTVDIDSGKQLAKTSLGATPSSVLTLPDGRVLATLSDVHRFVLLIPAESPALPLQAHSSVRVPTEPTTIAATPYADRALVVSRWGARISEIQLPRDGDVFVSRTLSLESDPFSAVVTGDGKQAVVSHVTGGKVSRVDLSTWTASVRHHNHRVRGTSRRRIRHHRVPIDRQKHLLNPFDKKHITFESAMQRPLPAFRQRTHVREPAIERTPLHGFAMVSIDDDIVIPVSDTFPGEPTRITTGYGSSVLFERPVQERLLKLSFGENERRTQRFAALPRCRLPRAATHSSEGRVFVACQGDATIVSDSGWGSAKVPSGPTGLAWDPSQNRLVVWSQQARQLSVVVPATMSSARAVVRHAMPFVSRDPLVTHGRELFFATDRRISSDGRSCASCHPGGRQDGLVWSTPDGPRQTPMLAGKLSGTAPYGWTGGAKSVEDHLTQTFRRLGGNGLSDHDKKALASYVKSLRVPVAAPEPTKKQLVAQGKAIFHSDQAECSSCHVENRFFSDTMTYPIVRASADRKSDFNTPALVGLANTAPYFHDGRFPTLLAMLEGTDGKMGHSSHLSGSQKQALVAYLQTL